MHCTDLAQDREKFSRLGKGGSSFRNFREFLDHLKNYHLQRMTQLYRVSLSVAPVLLERLLSRS